VDKWDILGLIPPPTMPGGDGIRWDGTFPHFSESIFRDAVNFWREALCPCANAQAEYDALMIAFDRYNEAAKKATIEGLKIRLSMLQGKVDISSGVAEQKRITTRLGNTPEDPFSIKKQVEMLLKKCPDSVKEREHKEFPDLDREILELKKQVKSDDYKHLMNAHQKTLKELRLRGDAKE
jgi:hypothetical protein